MAQPITSAADQSTPAPAGFRVWHLWLISVLVGVAIVNIQDQRRSEPLLIGLAVGGFVVYALLGWCGWRIARRFRGRLAPVPLLVIYLVAMSALFLAATVAYLFIEYAYLYGL